MDLLDLLTSRIAAKKAPKGPSIGPATSGTAFPAGLTTAEAGVQGGPKGALTAITRRMAPAIEEQLPAVKDALYEKYISEFFKKGQVPAAGAASSGGFLNLLGLGGSGDIELPNESGRRDPRLGPGTPMDQLKLSRDTLRQLLK